jgi:uncharacterized membrane protein (UPF0182 family)
MDQRKTNKWSYIAFGILLIIGLFLSVLRSLVDFVTNYQWFKFNTYIDTYLVKVKTEVFIIIPLSIIIGVGLYLYLKQLKQRYYHVAHIFYNKTADKIIHRIMIG